MKRSVAAPGSGLMDRGDARMGQTKPAGCRTPRRIVYNETASAVGPTTRQPANTGRSDGPGNSGTSVQVAALPRQVRIVTHAQPPGGGA
jgi:hypothetical protein